MTRAEAITELNVIYERLSHPEDCENGVYSFRDGDYLEALNMAIKSLEQEPKIGHWKPFDLTWGRSIYYCTSCEHSTNLETVFKYCPNCGAKMVEPQESEDKE